MGQRYWNGLVMSVLAAHMVSMLISSEVFRQDLFLFLHLCKVPTFKIYCFVLPLW